MNSEHNGNTGANRNVCEITDTIEKHTTTNECDSDQKDQNEIMDSENDVDCDNPVEVQEEVQNKASLNTATCVQPVNGSEIQITNVLNIAPAEGQTPTTYFQQPKWEALCFPKLFHTGLNTFNTNRPVKQSLKKYFSQRLTNKDPRFSERTEYIFQALDATEKYHILDY